MRCIVPVNTGACLSSKSELAQEYLRIRHMHRTETAVRHYIRWTPSFCHKYDRAIHHARSSSLPGLCKGLHSEDEASNR